MGSSMLSVFGSCVTDLVVHVPHLPLLGETLLASSLEQSPGGKGLNQAVSAARSGARVQMLGCIGDDTQGTQLFDYLKKADVDTSRVRIGATATGIGIPLVVPGGDNAIAFYGGANLEVDAQMVDSWQGAIAASDALIMQHELAPPALLRAAQLASDSGVPVVLNAAPANNVSDALLRLCDTVIVNEVELGQILGPVPDPTSGCEILVRRYGLQLGLVTLGAQGVVVSEKNSTSFEIPGVPVAPADTVGAGDALVGAFVAELQRTGNVRKAAEYGNAAAALAVTKRGAATSFATRSRVEELVRTQSLEGIDNPPTTSFGPESSR